MCLSSVCNACIVDNVRHRGSAMVPLDKAMTNFEASSIIMLSIAAMFLSARVWPQF